MSSPIRPWLPHSSRWLRAARLAVLVSVALGESRRLRRSPDLALRARWLHGKCRRIARILDLRVAAVDAPSPQTAGMLVANHLGYLDIIAIASVAPCVFVAKSEVRDWPFVGACAEAAGTLFVNRRKAADTARVGAELARVLAEGVRVVVFAEGTSTDGRAVLPFKSSLLAPAARADLPLFAAALGYEAPCGHSVETEIAWWGEMTLPGHLWNLLCLAWIHADLRCSPDPIRERDRKRAAGALHERVLALREHACTSPQVLPP